ACRPTATSSTPSPTASTTPAPPEPKSIGVGRGRLPSTTERSEWQTPAARIRTSTSPGPGASSSRSSIVNGRDLAYGRTRPLSRSTAPRMFTARRLSQGLRALLLVIGHDGDPPCVAVVSRERFGQERLDDGDRFVLRMLSGTDRDDLSIVVRTCQLRDLRV